MEIDDQGGFVSLEDYHTGVNAAALLAVESCAQALADMRARAENAEARLVSVYVTIDADHKRMMAMIDDLREFVDKAIAQRDQAET